VIDTFKTKVQNFEIQAACFGIAGPIINGRCITTNLPWNITTEGLQKQLECSRVRLLNDLEATAYGMLYLRENEFVCLNPHAVKGEGNIAVIAAGTGLGEAMLYFDGREFHPSGSEGGHVDFAPNTPQQDALLVWLRERYPEHVSYERILCGEGIATVYEFLQDKGVAQECEFMKNINSQQDKNAAISKCALENNDPLSITTLELFTEIYAQEAGNLALKTMALKGVYIGGGIAPKILPFMQSEHFINSFVKKGRFTQMLQNIDVKLSLNQETALIGAAHFAFDKLQ
jgi:glucokinase